MPSPSTTSLSTDTAPWDPSAVPFTNTPFSYVDGKLRCESVDLQDIAQQVGTPCYVYAANGILDRFRAYDRAFAGMPHRICYAVKANSNLSVLRLLAEAGAGFDIVSAGELYRVIQAGGDPGRVVFSGVGKTREEIEYALEQGIHGFNCESEPELQLLAAVARERGMTARASLRVNPDVDARTHPYISTGLREHKFGVGMDEAAELYRKFHGEPGLQWIGVSCHIGSQMLDVSPVAEAAEKLIAFVNQLKANGIAIESVDIGGGLGVSYQPSEQAPAIGHYGEKVLEILKGSGLTVMAEPGRSLVAEPGVLLSRVVYLKRTENRDFLIVDAAMNDLIRPSLYDAYHAIVPLSWTPGPAMRADVVGPVCESGDFLARNRELAQVNDGDYLAVCTAGAYGFVQASNYNSRPRPAEVLVDGDSWKVIRERETLADLVKGE